MHELLQKMSDDMHINRYKGESDNSFCYRLIYSALGQWCLWSAASPSNHISKQSQTLLLNNLLERYIELCQDIKESFEPGEDEPVSVFMRKVYEEIGYLITDEDNRNSIASCGDGIRINNDYLLFGVNNQSSVVGLGVYSSNVKNEVNWKDVLVRDNLSYEEYLLSQFDYVGFDSGSIPIEELKFFNPLSLKSPSSSWSSKMMTDKTIARKITGDSFYKVIRDKEELLLCDMPQNSNQDSLCSYEYRRLYYALKSYYNNPLRVEINPIDQDYVSITMGGHLPNREYYILLMCSWPDLRYHNRYRFIVPVNNLSFIKEVFNNLAIDIS